MSRIGKAPVEIPKGVKVAVNAGSVTVEGPLGKLDLSTASTLQWLLPWIRARRC